MIHSQKQLVLNYELIYFIVRLVFLEIKEPGPGCSELMTSLFNVLLQFQTLISEIRQTFFVEKRIWGTVVL